MTFCSACHHLHADSVKHSPRYTRAWMCMRFPQDAVDPVSGEQLPPYHRCQQVLSLGPAPGECSFFKEANPKQMEL